MASPGPSFPWIVDKASREARSSDRCFQGMCYTKHRQLYPIRQVLCFVPLYIVLASNKMKAFKRVATIQEIALRKVKARVEPNGEKTLFEGAT